MVPLGPSAGVTLSSECFADTACMLQVRVLRTLHHRNIVQFYGACLEPSSMFFVTELMKVASRPLATTPLHLWSNGSKPLALLCLGTAVTSGLPY